MVVCVCSRCSQYTVQHPKTGKYIPGNNVSYKQRKKHLKRDQNRLQDTGAQFENNIIKCTLGEGRGSNRRSPLFREDCGTPEAVNAAHSQAPPENVGPERGHEGTVVL